MACVAVAGPPGVVEGLSIYRGPSEDEFDRDQLAALERIVPHLRTALYTRRKLLELESRVSDMETTLDRLNTALVLVEASGKVLFANRNARTILHCRDGLVFDRGELIAHYATDGAALRAALVNATKTGTGKGARAVLISRANKRPLQIVAVPCRPETLGTHEKAATVVFITDPDQRVPACPETLRVLFSFTRAEIKLAMVLLDGRSLSEAAALNGVGRETVRSQLKSIFLKTNTRRQSELIGLLARLPEGNTGTEWVNPKLETRKLEPRCSAVRCASVYWGKHCER
jgi:DNA-binding CsgD family transcriptional regulator